MSRLVVISATVQDQEPTMTALTNDAPLRRLKLRRIIAGAGIALLGLAAGAGAFVLTTKLQLAGAHPAPGQLVDVGGYRMHLNCTGKGAVTVLLEAGNADFSLHWSRVQPDVAPFAKVCSYDRAGLGWSESSPLLRTAGNMVAELGALLSAGAVHGPYLLVGHSFGGVLMRAFAAAHPDDVAGLVLVDSAHAGQVDRLPGMRAAIEQGAAQFRGVAPLAASGLLAIMPGNIPDPGLPASALADYRALLATAGYFDAAAIETAALPGNLGGRDASLGDIPLVVVSRGGSAPVVGLTPGEAVRFEAEWQEMQRELLALSSRSTQVIASGSGHSVHLEQPEVVVDAIRRLAGEAM
jgi:pimeloyl-ACP methyl ester carboxylesterase